MEYLDSLKKYMSGKKYADSNIKTSDGKLAYVTNTGVSKLYPDDTTFDNTAGKNNCGSTDFIKLSPQWSDLGFPVGSLMVSGQSCGNENSYVQSTPPETTFDWNYYIQSNPDLNLTTESQAYDHWNTTGKQEGRLPNATVMPSMQYLGKVGYIDVNTTMHMVPPTYNGEYTSYVKTNITGINMEDCTRPIPTVNYGDQLILSFQDKTGFVNDSSVLETGTSVTNLFLRPPLGIDLQGKPVNYGDQVTFTTSTSSYTSNCGWWGCKVGRVNSTTQQFEFGPGGETTMTFGLDPPRGSAYSLGTPIKYGDPFLITSPIVKNDSVLEQDSYLLPGQSIKSVNGKYMFIYQTDGNVCLYNTNGGSIWCSMAVHTPGQLVLQSDGNLVAYDSGGIPQWATNTAGQGTSPYLLSVNNDQSVELTDASQNVLWSTQTNIQTSDTASTIPGVAYVNNSIVMFGTWSTGKNANTFSFKSQTTQPSTCDIEDMKKQCDETTCSGFIHSPATNSWQMITPTSTSDYTITNNLQDIYLKNATVNLGDSSCNPGTSKYIDSTLFSNYVMGDDFVEDGNGQCNVISPPKPPSSYVKKQKQQLSKGKQVVTKYNQLNVQDIQSQNVTVQNTINTKTNEYQSVLNNLKNVSKSTTLEQQYVDMTIFDDYNKNHAIIWGIIATLMITALLFRNKIET